MDKFEQLLFDCVIAVGLLGNVETGDFELVPLNGQVSEERERIYNARGLRFVGAIGLEGPTGPTRVALSMELPQSMRDSIRAGFVKLYDRALTRVENTPPDAIELERWFQMPDAREN
jgi:hypothetical protein